MSTISSPVAPPPQQMTNAQTLIDGQADLVGLYIFRNGLLLTPGSDYTRSGGRVSMVVPPVSGDLLTARLYAMGRQLGGPTQERYIAPWSLPLTGAYDSIGTSYEIVFGPTIAGVCDGVNTAFITSVSLIRMQVFKNGLLQTDGQDYGAFATVIVFKPGAVPQPGDIITVSGF